MGWPQWEMTFGRFVPSWRSEARLFINRVLSWQPSWRGQDIRSTFGNFFSTNRGYSSFVLTKPQDSFHVVSEYSRHLKKIFPIVERTLQEHDQPPYFKFESA